MYQPDRMIRPRAPGRHVGADHEGSDNSTDDRLQVRHWGAPDGYGPKLGSSSKLCPAYTLAMLFLEALLLMTIAGATPTDRQISIGGRQLHLRCEGERRPNAPLVVLEAGAGNDADTWRNTQTPISAFTRVCAYDRPGLGSSDRLSEPESPIAIVDRLRALLAAAEEPAPYVLVGHSYGGMLIRLYASRYAADVVGMVLVDSAHEDQLRRFAAIPGAPPPERTREQIDLPGVSAVLLTQHWHTSIPLVVLSRGRMGPPERAADPLVQALYRTWMDMQLELASRSSHSEHIIAATSDHYIQNEDPPLVIDAVRRVVASVADRPSGK
jgi:pimeloyl-ACP methyl ester carboxylesterase